MHETTCKLYVFFCWRYSSRCFGLYVLMCFVPRCGMDSFLQEHIKPHERKQCEKCRPNNEAIKPFTKSLAACFLLLAVFITQLWLVCFDVFCSTLWHGQQITKPKQRKDCRQQIQQVHIFLAKTPEYVRNHL